ncbi:hypothetical protein [Scytonema sp. NUACC26]|uniref:hypothetical protein n=1 Tax=Scytonema sp. NUACC26 TaxID=3140176 RepID=UPI0034DBF2EB
MLYIVSFNVKGELNTREYAVESSPELIQEAAYKLAANETGSEDSHESIYQNYYGLDWQPISCTIQAFVADGSCVSIDQTKAVEKALARKLNWSEVPDTRDEFGNFFQCYFRFVVAPEEYEIAIVAIEQYRSKIRDYR